MLHALRRLAAVALLCSLAACVTRGEHERLLAEAEGRFQSAQAAQAAAMATADAAAQKEASGLRADISRLEAEIADRNRQLEDQTRTAADLGAKLDGATALNQELRNTLEKAGKSVDKLLTEKGDLAKSLEGTKARLEELRKAQEAVQQRAELLRGLVARFKALSDAGNLRVKMRDGRLVLELANDVLFDSGRTSLKSDGQMALEEVANVLVTLTDRELQVAGHTDNIPISSDRFPSNWELSAARAVNVVKFLVSNGVRPELLSAAGFGEHDPIASNDDPGGRAKNRRIEIVLQPDLAELVQAPEIP